MCLWNIGVFFWLFWSKNRGRFLVYLMVQSTTRAICLPQKDTYALEGLRMSSLSLWGDDGFPKFEEAKEQKGEIGSWKIFALTGPCHGCCSGLLKTYMLQPFETCCSFHQNGGFA